MMNCRILSDLDMSFVILSQFIKNDYVSPKERDRNCTSEHAPYYLPYELTFKCTQTRLRKITIQLDFRLRPSRYCRNTFI